MTEEHKGLKEEQEVGQYERLASRTKELIESAKEKGPKVLDAALDKAKEEMIATGDFSKEQGKRLQAFVRRDLEATVEHVSQMGQSGSRRGRETGRMADNGLHTPLSRSARRCPPRP